jgi:hypothetical protein
MEPIGVGLIVVGVLLELGGIWLLLESARREIEAQQEYETREPVFEVEMATESDSALSATLSGVTPSPIEEQLASLRERMNDHLVTWKAEMRSHVDKVISRASVGMHRRHGRDIEHVEEVLRARRPSRWPFGLFAAGLLLQTAGGLVLHWS